MGLLERYKFKRLKGGLGRLYQQFALINGLISHVVGGWLLLEVSTFS